jgi:elongator complex protein 3
MDFYSEIISLILSGDIKSKQELHKKKMKLCKKYSLDDIPSDSDILSKLPDDTCAEDEELLVSVLRRKSMRTISGVAIVAVMTSPESCPHGQCIPCPGGPVNNTPQSYTGHEPAAMRASLNDFDPYLQTKNRIEQLKAIGHPVDKIDFIIMGGTFTARSPYYQEWFVKRCFDGLNTSNSKSLYEAQKKNEKADSRCIGLTVETRPDWFRLSHADQVLSYGATRVELGVQTVFDDILFNIKRGHSVSDSIHATRIAKECGLKICYHMMPGLVGSDVDTDIESFKTIFEDERFKPDMLKIYPTLTIENTKLFDMWKNKKYTPLSTKDATVLISKIKSFIPEWIRVQRIQRDVPAQFINAGVKKSNLRQLVQGYMKEHSLECRCIRCREIGHKYLKNEFKIDNDDIFFDTNFYKASGGEEVFITLVSKKHDALLGYLRLRDIKNSHRIELNKKPSMIIRELKVLGRELSIGKKTKDAIQHRGFGKELINEAERICMEDFDKSNLFVLSGIGVKEYYRKNGFKDDGLYLSKKLS